TLGSPNTNQDSPSALKVWDAATGNEVASVTDGEARFWGLAFRADGKQLVTNSQLARNDPNGLVKVWAAATGTELKTIRLPSLAPAVALSPDGSRIATVAGPSRNLRKTVRITDVATGTELHALNAPDVSHVEFSPDGRRLATFALGVGRL